MLAFKYRFHGHGSLRYVYKNGHAIRTHLLTLKYTKNPHRKHSRFSIVVSKKVHKSAVGRNRIRRRLYEIIREQLPLMTSPSDVVLIVLSDEVRHMAPQELQETITQLFTQAGLHKGQES